MYLENVLEVLKELGAIFGEPLYNNDLWCPSFQLSLTFGSVGFSPLFGKWPFQIFPSLALSLIARIYGWVCRINFMETCPINFSRLILDKPRNFNVEVIS